MQYRGGRFELKSVDLGERVITGMAAYHNNLDRVGDVIDPSASVKAVRRIRHLSDIGVFIGHDTASLPAGIPLKIEAHPEGLYTETKIKPGPVGDDLLATAKFLRDNGQALGMSIGYRTHDARPDRIEGKSARRIMDYELGEYSFAAPQMIANPRAVALTVKARRKALSEGSDTGGGMLVPPAHPGGRQRRAKAATGTDGPMPVDAVQLPCASCVSAGTGSFATPNCTCPGCMSGGTCLCGDAWDTPLANQKTTGGGRMLYRVAQQGNQWAVLCDTDGDGDADDNRVVGSYNDEMTANQVATALRAEANEAGDDDDEDDDDSEDNSIDNDGKTRRRTAERKAVWTTKYENALPDSAFLYLEDGGAQDSDGKRVPRSKRHFPYKDATGKIDLPHLRNAIARIPQSNADGLTAAKKDALQARARRMLEDAQDGKTIQEPLEWKTGTALSVRGIAYELIDLSETLAQEFKAMRLLGEETKDCSRVRAPQRAALAELSKKLAALVTWTDIVDRQEDGVARRAWMEKQLALTEI